MERRREASIAYLTIFDINLYRRPIFAKRFVGAKIYYHKNALNSSAFLKELYEFNRRYLAKAEAKIYPHTRNTGGALVSALVSDLINCKLFSKLPENVVMVIDPSLGSRRIWGDRYVIVDWLDVWMWPWDQLNIFDQQTLEDADGVIFWSRPFMEIMRRRLRLKKTVYIPHGIDLNEFDPTKVDPSTFRRKYGMNDSFIITYSGGVWSPYGFDLQGIGKLISAAALAIKRMPKARLVLQLLNMDKSLLSLLKRLGIRDKTLVIGRLPYSGYERMALFAASDVFVAPNSRHPTAYYAERIKFFQYMAAGKAILAERTPGAVSALGDAAYYVELNDVTAMADALVELYEDRDLREKLGKKARERIEKLFEWMILGDKLKKYITSLID